ncbi:ribosome assembly RNA-binding protein YhbY [Spongiibacter taiwanensis]|uniref:ribosome assembly RNA-binding protein YhbY n=1 Tax=Spongiibacter taiwanensis TaxID=1748242 RepID=UPI002035E647|nr:ribosome assembly RNA-binding protein YhbY [Spongiibacter taiwanensis]USA42405.1 ribosome assembly RNA-binding protein YhbY [Spongiibacter taiwanensis]
MPQLSASDKKHLRGIGHKLNPVVMIGDKGISEGVEAELERALNDHELIKIKVNADADVRGELIEQLCQSHSAMLVQAVGKIALLYRPAKKPNPKLSNLLR